MPKDRGPYKWARVYVNLDRSGGRPATKRGSAVSIFGPQIGIHYWIFTKFGTLMGTMVPHYQPKFSQKRPPNGGEIEYARYFWVGHVAHVPEP